jgi:hypothetical protein
VNGGRFYFPCDFPGIVKLLTFVPVLYAKAIGLTVKLIYTKPIAAEYIRQSNWVNGKIDLCKTYCGGVYTPKHFLHKTYCGGVYKHKILSNSH